MAPNTAKYHIQDVGRAGGIVAIMAELAAAGLVDTTLKRVDGLTLAEEIDKWCILSPNCTEEARKTYRVAPCGRFNIELGSQKMYYDSFDTDRSEGCIRDVAHAYTRDGGLAVLFGNIALDGCIVKTAGVDESIFHFEGPARVFDSQEAACEGILGGKVGSGDVVVITYEGPKGGPGMHADNLLFEAQRIDGDAVLCQALLPVGEVDAGAVEDGARAAGDADDVDFEPARAHQLFALLGDLVDEAAAHSADAAEEEVEFLILGQEEAVMDDVEGLAQLAALHDEGNVGLGGALRQGDHADAVASQGGEKLAGDARMLLHVLADHGDGGQFLADVHGIDGAAFDFAGEGLVEDLAGAGGVSAAHADGNARFGCGLAHEEGADLLLGECGEYAAVHTHDTDHGGARKGDQGDVVDGRYALDGGRAGSDGFFDDCPFCFQIESILDENGMRAALLGSPTSIALARVGTLGRGMYCPFCR